MPLYMDIHHKIDGLTAEAIKGAHEQDVKVQAEDVVRAAGRQRSIPATGGGQLTASCFFASRQPDLVGTNFQGTRPAAAQSLGCVRCKKVEVRIPPESWGRWGTMTSRRQTG